MIIPNHAKTKFQDRKQSDCMLSMEEMHLNCCRMVGPRCRGAGNALGFQKSLLRFAHRSPDSPPEVWGPSENEAYRVAGMR